MGQKKGILFVKVLFDLDGHYKGVCYPPTIICIVALQACYLSA